MLYCLCWTIIISTVNEKKYLIIHQYSSNFISDICVVIINTDWIFILIFNLLINVYFYYLKKNTNRIYNVYGFRAK